MDSDWLEMWKRQPFPLDLEEPRVEQLRRVLFTVTPPNLERAWDALKARVAATNEEHERTVVPAREAAQKRTEEADTARERTIDELQERLDALE